MPINAFQLHVQIPYFTAVPEDVITNVWSLQFSTLEPLTANWTAAIARFQTFYATVYSATNFQMAPWCRPLLTRWKGYDLNDAIPRAPRHDVVAALTVSTLTSSGAVPEAAQCLSFQGVTVSGTPQARRRGRIFLGGLATPCDLGTASVFPATNGAARTNIPVAAAALKSGLTTDGWTWSVYSRTDDAMVTVANGWMDNAPDTQRRRGNTATARTTFS